MPVPTEDIPFLKSQGYTDEEIANLSPIQQQQPTNGSAAPSIPQTIGRVAKAHAGGYLGGGAGAIGGGALASLAAPWLLGPEAGIPADLLMLGGGIVGAGVGGYAGQKAQQAVQSDETNQQQQEAAALAEQTNPKTALATDIAGSALASGGAFSPTTAVKGIGGLIGKLGGKPLTQEAKSVLLQSALNPAISTGMSVAQGQGIPSGGELLGQAAGGALFAKSWLSHGRAGIDEPSQELNNTAEGQAASQDSAQTGAYTQPVETPFSAKDENGDYKIGNKSIFNLFMKQVAMPLPKDADDITKAYIRTQNEKLKQLPVDSMRDQLHQIATNKSIQPLNESGENEDYAGGEMPNLTGITGLQEPKPEVSNQTKVPPAEPERTTPPIFTPEVLQSIIDRGATKPVSVQRIFPKLNLTTEEANQALHQANLLAELHINRPEEQNATGIRENTGQPNQTGQVGEGSKVGSGSNMVEKTPGSSESIPQEVSRKVPINEGKSKVVNSPLSDYNRYNVLNNQRIAMESKITDPEELMGNTQHQAISKELEDIKSRNEGMPPKPFPENRILMPLHTQTHILSGRATNGSVLHSLANTPDHELQPLFKAMYDATPTSKLNVPIRIDPTLDKTENWRSHYDPGTDQINLSTGASGDARVVAEEIAHSLTEKNIPFFKGQGEEYYNRLNTYLKNGKNASVKDLISSYLDTAKALGKHDELFKDTINPDGSVTKGLAGNADETTKVLSGLGHSTKYALGNLSEHLVQAMKDPQYQRVLEGIKTKDGRTVWQTIVDAVKKLLGLDAKTGSMLERVLRTSGELVSQERPDEVTQSTYRIQSKPPEEQSKAPDELSLPKDKYMGRFGLMFRSVIDKVRDIKSPLATKLADHFQMATDKETELKGRWKNAVVQAGEKLSSFDKQKLGQVFNAELATKTPHFHMLTNANQRSFYNLARSKIHESGDYRLRIGEPVTQAISKGNKTIYVQRDLKKDPMYYPGMANQKVMDVYRANTNSPEIARLDKEFNDYNTQTLKLTPNESAERIQNFKTALQGSVKNSDISHQDYFNAHRKAEGSPLPPTFREADPVRNLERYFDRAAIDASHYEFLEKDPQVMSSLGQTKDAWGKDVPSTGNESLANNPAVRSALEHWRGEVRNPAEYNESSLASLFSSGFIAGPALELHKVVSNVVKSLATTSNPLVLSRAITHSVANIASGYQHAVENGVVKLTSRSALGMINGSYTSAERMQSAARLIRKVSTLNDLTTKVGSGLVQSINEVIIPSKVARANAGNVTSQQFIRRLDPTYTRGKEYSEQEMQQLASRSANYIHGTGDIRSLPAWMLNDSEFSGFFSLAHWSIAQTNNFMKEVYEPATRGDIKPLVVGLVGAALGGYVIKELRQDIQGKKGPIPSLSEIASSDRGLEGNKGLIGYNLMAACTYAGFGGLLSQLAKYPFDFVYKNQPMGATFPMDEIATDTASTVRFISEALANDPNVNYGEIAKQAAMHMLSTNFQLSRIAINQGINNGLITGLPAEKKNLSDRMGQLRRFDMVEGLPYQGIDEGSNPYMNIEQKQFKLEQDPQKAIQQLPGLISHIVTAYGSQPDVMFSKLKALKENTYETFPSMEQMPISTMKYIGYLQRYEGQEAAQSELQDYLKHKITNEMKSSVVP